MDVSDFEYNGNLRTINIKTLTPAILSRVLNVPDIETRMLCDESYTFHQIQGDQFIPKLEAQKKYFFYNDDNNSHPKQPQAEEKFAYSPTHFENDTTPLKNNFSDPQQTPQQENPDSDEPQKNKYQQQPENFTSNFQQKKSTKNQPDRSQAMVLQDNKAYLESGKKFFENITNGCVAVEELILLTASTPDVKLAEGRSLRVSILEAVRVLGKSYSEAGNAMNKAKLNFGEVSTRIRQCLEIFSTHGNTSQYFEILQNAVYAGVKAVEEKKDLFESASFAFIELEQSIYRAQEDEKQKIETERNLQKKIQMEMQKIEKDIKQKQEEIRSMDAIIASYDVDITAFQNETAKKKNTGFFGFGGSNNESQNAEQIQALQKELHSARKRKSQLQDDIDILEGRKIDVKHKIKNAKTEPSTNWQTIMDSLKIIISQMELIQQTWKSIALFIKTIENEPENVKILAMKGQDDNTSLINAALRLCLDSWVILQCCEIYDDIVKSHIVPLISKVSSNFGLRVDEAKSKLSNEKTKAKNIKYEVATLANKRLTDAINDLATISKETEKGFCNLFSTNQ